MGKPSLEFLPRTTPRIPLLFIKQEAIFFLILKESVQFFGRARVDNDRIGLVIPAEAACVKVGTAHSTDFSVYHDDFGVVKTRLVHP